MGTRVADAVVRDVRTVYDNTWFRVVEKSGHGFPSPYYVLEAADYVTILALTGDDEVALVRQFRPAVESLSLELPSGHIDAGESPLQAATRELREETGREVVAIEQLAPLAPNTGRHGNRLWAFFARLGNPLPGGYGPESGIELVLVPHVEIPRLVREGRLAHALDLAVYALAVAHGRLP